MRQRDRLTSVMLAVGVLHAVGFGIGTVAAQQATGTPADGRATRISANSPTATRAAIPPAAIRACTAVLDRQGANAPTSATRIFVLHKRANAYRERAEYAPAIADYSAVIALDAKDANAHYNRANVHLLRNDQNAAIADYRKAVELRPGLGVAHLQLGSLLLARNELRTALDHFDQAVRIDGRDTAALVGRGLARERLGDLDGAIASLSEAVTQTPDNVAFRLMRAQLLRRKGENARRAHRSRPGAGTFARRYRRADRARNRAERHRQSRSGDRRLHAAPSRSAAQTPAAMSAVVSRGPARAT